MKRGSPFFLSAFLLASLFTQEAFADSGIITNQDGATFYSRNGLSKAVLGDGGRKYTVFRNNRQLYSIQTRAPFRIPPAVAESPTVKSAADLGFRSGQLYVTDDASTVVWLLAPIFFGHLMLFSYDKPEVTRLGLDRLLMTSPALAFFRNGKLVRTYDLKTLLKHPELVSETTSHTYWLSPNAAPQYEKQGSPPALSDNGRHFSFQTTSFQKYVFDACTGKRLSVSPTDFWRNANVIAWGKLESTSTKDSYLLKESRFLKGDPLEKRLIFRDPTGSYRQLKNGWCGVALTKAGNEYVTVAPAQSFPKHWEPW